MTDTALVPVEPKTEVSLGTLQANTAEGMVTAAASMATALAAVVDRQQLYVELRGRRHVKVEGWTTLAAMLGCTPHEVSVTSKDGVYCATVELRRLKDGAVVSRASAECGANDEFDREGRPMWAARPSYARRSMALTRATGKACRLAFSWIMTLAGYDATPAEEIEVLEHAPQPAPSARPPALPTPQSLPNMPITGHRKVKSVEVRSKDDKRWWVVTFEDGYGGSTWDEKVAETALIAKEDGKPVKAILERSKKNPKFWNLIELVIVADGGPFD